MCIRDRDKHTGFLVGTDDYMTKPPDKTELLLRIKALLRRARIVDEHKITVGDVVVDMDSRTVRRGMEVQTLPPKEFELLYKLLAYPERTFTRMEPVSYTHLGGEVCNPPENSGLPLND